MEIQRYSERDKPALFRLLENEGAEWGDYWGAHEAKYSKALENSLVYIAYENDTLCGYCRCRDDDGFGIYVYDLLIDKEYRGKQIGRTFLDRVCSDFPGDDIYVMSDADDYYEKQGFEREGSIFKIQALPNNC